MTLKADQPKHGSCKPGNSHVGAARMTHMSRSATAEACSLQKQVKRSATPAPRKTLTTDQPEALQLQSG
jgi:hypothetical protein